MCLATIALSMCFSTAIAETSKLAVLGACAELQRDGLLLPVEGLTHMHAVAHPDPVLDNVWAYLAALKYNSPEQKLAQEGEIMKGVTEAYEMALTDADCADALVSVHVEYCTFRRDIDPPLGLHPVGESCDPLDIIWGGHHPNGQLLMRALGLAD